MDLKAVPPDGPSDSEAREGKVPRLARAQVTDPFLVAPAGRGRVRVAASVRSNGVELGPPQEPAARSVPTTQQPPERSRWPTPPMALREST